MEKIEHKFDQNLQGPQSFSVFGDSVYEPQGIFVYKALVPMPFLNEIHEHERIPKIALNPQAAESSFISEQIFNF